WGGAGRGGGRRGAGGFGFVGFHGLERGAPEALACGDGQDLAGGDALGADHVALVGAVFDLAADALPILLERIVARDDRLQLEALGGVPDLLAPQDIDPAIDVFARDRRLDPLDTHEVLL